MKSVIVWDYSATGEGMEIRIFFRNSAAMPDELAVDLMMDRLGAYLASSIEILPLETIKLNKEWMDVIEAHTPLLHKYILGKRDYAITVDYHSHVNCDQWTRTL